MTEKNLGEGVNIDGIIEDAVALGVSDLMDRGSVLAYVDEVLDLTLKAINLAELGEIEAIDNDINYGVRLVLALNSLGLKVSLKDLKEGEDWFYPLINALADCGATSKTVTDVAEKIGYDIKIRGFDWNTVLYSAYMEIG